MICSLFNIMVIYFYETSLLFLTLNYRYILGSTSHSSANLQILFLSIFPNNLQYFVKYSTLHRWHDGPRQVSVELSNLTQGCDPSSLLGQCHMFYQDCQGKILRLQHFSKIESFGLMSY